jgi:conjugal transfer/type IV secretion protein DotA/TraY
MRTLKAVFAALLIAIAFASAPALAQTAAPTAATTGQIPSVESIQTNIFRPSIPAGDTVAQTIFSILPTPSVDPSAKTNAGETIGGMNAQKFNSTFPAIVGVFNIIIMIMGMAMLAYQGVVWWIDYGNEGTPNTQGSGMTAIWSPLRFSIGLMMLAPVPGGAGWTPMQFAVAGIAKLGYNGGDYMWQYVVGLSAADKRQPLVPPINPKLPEMVANIGMIEACRVVSNFFAGNREDISNLPFMIWRSEINEKEAISRVVPNPAFVQAIPRLREMQNYCGEVVILRPIADKKQPNVSDEMAFSANVAALQVVATNANEFSTALIGLIFNRNEETLKGFAIAADSFVRKGVDAYSAKLAEVQSQILRGGDNRNEAAFQTTAAHAGWTNAGYFFLTYTNISSSAAQVARNLPRVTPPDLEKMLSPQYRGSVQAVKDVLHPAAQGGILLEVRKEFARIVDPQEKDWQLAGTGQQSGVPGAAPSTGFGWFSNVSAEFANIMRRIIDPTSTGTGTWNPNPIATMIETGHTIINWSAAIVFADALAPIAAAAAGTATAGPLGTAMGFVGGLIAGKVASAVMAPLMIIAGPMLLVGIAYAYIIPMIVWAMWATVVLGWIMLVFEAILVSSLWALSHARMDGKSGFAGNAMHGYAVMFQLLVRPIIGSIAIPVSILIYSMIVNGVTSSAYRYSLPAMAADNAFGPIGAVVVVGIVTLFQIALLVWCLNLPNVIFENLNMWLGMNGIGGHNVGQVTGKIAAMGTTAGAAELTSTGGAALKGAAAALAKKPDNSGAAAANQQAAGEAGNRSSEKASTGGASQAVIDAMGGGEKKR